MNTATCRKSPSRRRVARLHFRRPHLPAATAVATDAADDLLGTLLAPFLVEHLDEVDCGALREGVAIFDVGGVAEQVLAAVCDSCAGSAGRPVR